ncbi:hypothetical protein [Burkholderia pseudomallei]|uniref:hypothetical protein n=1 Tax=Burkholderia pseudomallei TaxID=28450 RepID=UPI00130D7F2A|nr:hypothetical protein [Burkholderia pseudomallei]
MRLCDCDAAIIQLSGYARLLLTAISSPEDVQIFALTGERIAVLIAGEENTRAAGVLPLNLLRDVNRPVPYAVAGMGYR